MHGGLPGDFVPKHFGVVSIKKHDSALNHDRRIKFADMLKAHGVTRESQLTADKQKELFAELDDWSDRCAFRSFLTGEFGLVVGSGKNSILSDDQLSEAASVEGVLA